MQHEFKSYYAVIFTSKISDTSEGYSEMATKMETLAENQPGFLGFESARGELGISVSYWETLKDIQNWKFNSEHLFAQQQGKQKWYDYYKVRICKVEREYEFGEE
jgi:heme-degrading monooxygenase HmoA